MSETRYIDEYDDQGNVINRIPFEVSDEQLAEEADTARLKKIAAMGHSAIPLPVLSEGLSLLCKKLGYS